VIAVEIRTSFARNPTKQRAQASLPAPFFFLRA